MLYLRLHWNTKTTQRFRCNSLGLSYHCSLFHIQRDVMSLWVLYSPIDGFKLRWDYHLRFIMDNIIYRYNARRDFQFRTWWASQKLAHTVCPKVSSRTPCPSGGVKGWCAVVGAGFGVFHAINRFFKVRCATLDTGPIHGSS